MANLTKLSSLKLTRLRAVKLDADGTFLTGASSVLTVAAPILLKHSGNVPDRERFEQANGEGDDCAVYVGPPRAVRDVELSTELCTLDAQLIEFLAGGSLFTETADTVGYQPATDSTVNEDGVAIEAWSLAWNGRQRALKAGTPATWRYGFAKTTWQVGEITNENGFAKIPLTGVGEANLAFEQGPDADWPQDLVAPWGYWLDGTEPAAAALPTAFPIV